MSIQETFWLLIQAFSLFIVGLTLNTWKEISKVAGGLQLKEKEINLTGMIALCFVVATYKIFLAIGQFFDLGYLEVYSKYIGWVFPSIIMVLSYSIWKSFTIDKEVSSHFILSFCIILGASILYVAKDIEEAVVYALIYTFCISAIGLVRWSVLKSDNRFFIAFIISILQIFGLLSQEFLYDPYNIGEQWFFGLSTSLFSLSVFLFLHDKFKELGGSYIKGLSVYDGFIAWFAVFFCIWLGYIEAIFYGENVKEGMAYIEMGLIAAIIIFSFHFKGIHFSVARYVEAKSIERTMALLDGIDAAAILCTKDGYTQEANKSALDLFQSNKIKNVPLWEAWGIPQHIVDKIFNDNDNKEWHVEWDVEESGVKRHLEGTVRLLPDGSRIVATARDQTEKKKAEDELEKFAREDALTKLPNRRALSLKFKHQIDQAIKNGDNFYVAFADLDLLKKVNDIAGHKGGDQFLIDFSNKLKKISSENDLFVARFSGDEFIIVFPPNMNSDNVYSIVSKIKQEVMKPFLINTMHFNLDLSVGISMWPKDGFTAEEVISHADVALYKAKESGYGNIMFYGESMASELSRKIAIENILKESFKKNQNIFQYYQPQFSTKDKSLVGAESLFRFYSESLGGFVSPEEAIVVAENCGLSWELGRWSLYRALEMANELNQININIKVSVNVSAKQFDDIVFWNKLKELAETEDATKKIKIEITEGSLIEDMGTAKKLLSEFVDLGYTISIDDFGVGYSSLSYLLNFPFEELKLDKSFIDDIGKDNGAETLIKASFFIAENKGMKVVAEGVETEEQFNWLKENGCDAIQGYYLGKPMNQDQFLKKFSN